MEIQSYSIEKKLEKLKNNSFETLKKIDSFSISESKYYAWDKRIAQVEPYNCKKGIGGRDKHFLLETTILLNEYPKENLYLWTTTDDENMWDTNNPQMLVLINDQIIRALDTNHQHVELDATQEKANIKVHIYTNTDQEDVFVNCSLMEKHEGVFAYYHMMKSLYEGILLLDDQVDKKQSLQEIFLNSLTRVDFKAENYSQNFIQSVEEANRVLMSSLENIPSSASIIEHVIGHTHIDISWLWGYGQTKEKVVRSFSNAIYLMDRYPHMTFMSSQPLLYKMVKELSPSIYNKIKELVAEGRWEVEGSMFIESDINLPSGEALIRQIYKGKKFFKQEFNKDNQILWLPDVFGYSAALPQILKGSDVEYFFTSKIDWNDTNKLPNDTFLWKGIDGSEILTHLLTTSDYHRNNEKGTTYNGRLNASQVLGTWTRYQNKNLTNQTFQIYGFGDGGGGPTEEMLENYQLFNKGISPFPKTVHSTASQFFNTLKNELSEKEFPKWTGELYLENHRGVYTTDARLKKLNRISEHLLLKAECFIAMTNSLLNVEVDIDLEDSWEKLLINHFHDIITGTSIRQVHDEAVIRYKEIIEKTEEVLRNLEEKWSERFTSGILVYNVTSHARDELLSIEGQEILIESIPPSGYLFIPEDEIESLHTPKEKLLIEKGKNHFETELYEIVINEKGEIERLFYKEIEEDVLDRHDSSNQFILYDDYPNDFDAWNIDRGALFSGKVIHSKAKIRIIKNTYNEAVIQVSREFYKSEIDQTIHFYRHTQRIDFKTKVDWQEEHQLLKVKFSTPIESRLGTFETQFGYIQRNNFENTSWDKAKFEVCGHRWADLSEKGFGISLLNDSKYGYRIIEKDIYLSLLRSPMYPAENIDKGNHSFVYSLLPHIGDETNEKISQEARNINQKVEWVKTRENDNWNNLNDRSSIIQIDKENVICESIKITENMEEYRVRLYESIGKTVKTKVSFGFPLNEITETNLLGEKASQVELLNSNEIELKFKPFEIKTFVLKKQNKKK